MLVATAWFRAVAGKLGSLTTALYATGLDVTVLAMGAALVILAITRAQSSEENHERKGFLSGRTTAIFRWYGRNSYEVYLTHAFVAIWGVQWFRRVQAPINTAPIWFLGILVVAGLIGAAVARWFSEPMNKRLREKLGVGR